MLTLKTKVMRKELIEIENIERYLLNKMSASEKTEFEKDINSNPKLKAKVEAQKTVMDAVNRMAVKQSTQNAYKSYKLQSLLTKLIVLLAIIAVAGFVTLKMMGSDAENNENESILEENISLLPENDSISTFSNQLLDEEVFSINTKQDTVIENKDGVIIFIPANAFDTDSDNIDVLVQSAINAEDILYAGLSTTSNGNELETGGMFYVDAFDNGERVNLVKDLQVDVPTQNKVDGMQVYQGEKTTDGEINWVNPAPLKNKLTPVDILTLDFFPPTYDNTLTDWGYPKKEFKDSLYYSFAFEEEAENDLSLESVDESDEIVYNTEKYREILDGMTVDDFIKWDFDSKYIGNNTYEIIITVHQLDGWHIYAQEQPIGGVSQPTEFIFRSTDNFKLIGRTKEYGAHIHGEGTGFPEKIFDGDKAIFKQKIQVYEDVDLEIDYYFMACLESCFPPEFRTTTLNLKVMEDIDYIWGSEGVNPASIKTIWHTKFNNTNLATTQFEERLVWIHKSCNQQVLDLYINNLDKSLAEIDSMVIPLVSGEVKTKFIEFAIRNDGKVEVNDAATQKLSQYYQFKLKAEAKALIETQQNYWKEQDEKDNQQLVAEGESVAREINNKAEVFQKEFKKNLCKVYDELDYPQDCNRPPVAPGYYSVSVSQTGWNNIDKQVYIATINRETTSFSYEGKTSSVTYNEWSGIVNDYEKFDRINVYNIPKAFKSYVKIAGQNGTYNYKLNADLKYETVILAWTEEGLFYAQKNTKPGTDSYTPKEISENEFKTKIKSSLSEVHNMDAELDFVANSQKNVKRVNENIKRQALRNKVEPIVFPCDCVEPDTTAMNIVILDEME